MAPTYDHRNRTANFDMADMFHRLMADVRGKTRKLEKSASDKVLREIEAMIANFGLKLILNKSAIDQYRVGSDSWGASAYLFLEGDLGKEGVAGAVWDVTRMDPKMVDSKGPGQWVVQMEWGG